MRTIKRPLRIFQLLIIAGIILFALLYIVAAALYPGGSYAAPKAQGFSWLHNYWCDLLAVKAHNGSENKAMPVAIAAMLLLAGCFAIFWYYVPGQFIKQYAAKQLARFCGTTSLFIGCFLFTSWHDTVVILAGMLGFTALLLLLRGLYKKGSTVLFYTGVFCLLLMLLNYIILISVRWLFLLPVIQKISFVFFLSWFAAVTLRVIPSGKSGT